MKIDVECLPCAYKMIGDLVARSSEDPVVREKIFRIGIKEIGECIMRDPPPAYARAMQQALRAVLGDAVDLYDKDKRESTEVAKKVLGCFQDEIAVEKGFEGFANLVRLCIGGNIIDCGIFDSLDMELVRKKLQEVFELPVNMENMHRLYEDMAKAKRIFYILDNCGEAVFDAELVKRYRDKVTIAVRGGNVFNDVTRNELEMSGFSGVKVVDSGDIAPGTLVKYARPEFIDTLYSADLVIAKGQGNFEGMEGFEGMGGREFPVYFLFRAKCPVVRHFLGGVPANSIQIVRQGGEVE